MAATTFPEVANLDAARQVLADVLALPPIGEGLVAVYLTLAGVGPIAVLPDGEVRQAEVTASGEWVTL